jgi:hypothetical protein
MISLILRFKKERGNELKLKVLQNLQKVHVKIKIKVEMMCKMQHKTKIKSSIISNISQNERWKQ